MRCFLIVSFLTMLMACTDNHQSKSPFSTNKVPTGKSIHSEAFNQSFGELLSNYYHLKDNFIAENDTAIHQIAQKMMIAADSLKLSELAADSSLISLANTYAMGISSELKGLLGEKDLKEKRKEFQLVGDQLYDLIKTVKYDRDIVYRFFCVSAFNDQGAFWLSNSTELQNPYLSKKATLCGEIKDSIDLRPRE